jgi:putative membrane protein
VLSCHTIPSNLIREGATASPQSTQGLLAAAFAITSWILTGMSISGGFWAYVWVSALFGVVNAIIGTILRIVTFPLTVLTLGLFS